MKDNRERDKFLTKLMGECYHERSAYGFCKHCGAHNFITNHFSTWEGFGKLLGFMKKQDCWNDFVEMYECNKRELTFIDINPNDFADFVFDYYHMR